MQGRLARIPARGGPVRHRGGRERGRASYSKSGLGMAGVSASRARLIAAALALCSLWLAGCAGCGAVEHRPVEARVALGDVSFAAEIADTDELRAKGLGYRNELAAGAGMLFVYKDERRRTFWMKGMRFPLDFIWIGADCVVVDIDGSIPAPAPGTIDARLPIVSSSAPAAYVLEINAGEAARYGVEIGDGARFGGMGGRCE